MPDIDIDKLQIEVSASSEDATKKIRKLASSMRSLKKALAETNSVNSLTNSLKSLSSAIKDAGATVEMANAIKSIGKQEAKIANVADHLLGISKMDFSNLTSASNVIGQLAEIAASVKESKISSVGEKPNAMPKKPIDLGEEYESTKASRALAFSLELVLEASQKAANGVKRFAAVVLSLLPRVENEFWSASSSPLKKFTDNIKNAITSVRKFTSSYSRIIGTEFHKSLDKIGSVAAPIINFVKPAFDALANSIANARNILAKFLKSAFDGIKTASGGSLKNFFNSARNTNEEASRLAYALDSVRVGIVNIAKSSLLATWNVSKFGASILLFPLKGFTNSVKNAIASVRKFTSSIGRILMYRAIRTLLKEVTESIKDGINNLSAYSRLIGTEFHKSLDGIASDALYIKNSLASVAAPIINFVKPAFDALADSIANALNILADFMARMTGAASYSKAIKFNTEYGDSIQKAGEKAKKAKANLLGIDELNIFQDPTSGTSGGFSADDYSKMFEEVKLNTEQFSLADEIKFALEHDGWAAAGEVLAANLNGLIKGIDVSSLGKRLGEKVNNAISFAYGFLDGTSFVKIGAKVATFLNSTFSEINFETIGRIFTRKFTALFDFIIGFVSTLDWKQIGKAIGDYLRGAFNEISDWSKTVNWSEFARNLWRDVRDFIKGIDFGSLARSFFSFLGSAFSVAVLSIGGFFSGVWEDVCEYFRNKTEEAGGDTWEGFKKGVKDAWNGVKDWVKTNIVDPFVTAVKDLFGIHSPSTVFQGIGEDIIAGLKNGLRNKWNELKLWWKQQELPSFKVKLPHLSWTTTPASGWISKTLSALGLPTSLPKLNVAWYAKGGFPEDGLFYANHNELVGQFSNGRTAVANNEQITEGIADAVYNAFMSAFSATGNNDNRPIEIYLDGKQIATSTTKYQRQYARATGV